MTASDVASVNGHAEVHAVLQPESPQTTDDDLEVSQNILYLMLCITWHCLFSVPIATYAYPTLVVV